MDFINIGIVDIIDISIVALILWQVFKLIKGTTAMTIFIGIVMIYIIWIVVQALHMELMSAILSQILGLGAIALIVVFQQEVRQYLLMIGNRLSQPSNKFLRRLLSSNQKMIGTDDITEIVNAVNNMSSKMTGALIVFQRTSNMVSVKESGDLINSNISSRLIETIFFKNTPLHDGAMIIADGKIKYARCILPVSDNMSIPANLGLRHRAAVGITESTDAFALVVSEQTGNISITDNGEIKTLNGDDNLKDILTEKMKTIQ